jgi:Tfp pilus assembly protein PilO
MLKKFNINLDEKAKVIITTTVIAFVTFFICFSFTKDRIRKRHDMHSKIAEESEKLILRDNIDKIESKQNKYVKYFYDTMDQESFRLIISGLAEEADAEIISIKPLSRKRIANISKDFLKISLRCTYNQLVEFIVRIEKLPEIVKIEELSVKGLLDFESYAIGDEDRKKELIESDIEAMVSLVVAAYSTKH